MLSNDMLFDECHTTDSYDCHTISGSVYSKQETKSMSKYTQDEESLISKFEKLSINRKET